MTCLQPIRVGNMLSPQAFPCLGRFERRCVPGGIVSSFVWYGWIVRFPPTKPPTAPSTFRARVYFVFSGVTMNHAGVWVGVAGRAQEGVPSASTAVAPGRDLGPWGVAKVPDDHQGLRYPPHPRPAVPTPTNRCVSLLSRMLGGLVGRGSA